MCRLCVKRDTLVPMFTLGSGSLSGYGSTAVKRGSREEENSDVFISSCIYLSPQQQAVKKKRGGGVNTSKHVEGRERIFHAHENIPPKYFSDAANCEHNLIRFKSIRVCQGVDERLAGLKVSVNMSVYMSPFRKASLSILVRQKCQIPETLYKQEKFKRGGVEYLDIKESGGGIVFKMVSSRESVYIRYSSDGNILFAIKGFPFVVNVGFYEQLKFIASKC
ncbi:hypothetical protein NPIL_199681 [Nephila pilipes]|uniref:Uncharacterized protein n=1 Tax=Nephila pilipes TaxID=299642 RepID=A0A8X6TL73_NEPPI|nr:hypothetical protein NPIL_199681 [Nephila pilipes]